jgi:hypothetical protein
MNARPLFQLMFKDSPLLFTLQPDKATLDYVQYLKNEFCFASGKPVPGAFSTGVKTLMQCIL